MFLKHHAANRVFQGHRVNITWWSKYVHVILKVLDTSYICIPNINSVFCIDPKLQASLKYLDRQTDRQTEPNHYAPDHSIHDHYKSTTHEDYYKS